MNRQQAVNFLKILKYDFEQNALKAEKEIKKHRLMSNANMLQQIIKLIEQLDCNNA